jgi:hypothetical protein
VSSRNEPGWATGGRGSHYPTSGGDRPDIDASLPHGVRVQVWNGFESTWASGFQIFAPQPDGGYLVRRLSDRSVLPITFPEAEVRLDPVPLPAAGSTPPAVA